MLITKNEESDTITSLMLALRRLDLRVEKQEFVAVELHVQPILCVHGARVRVKILYTNVTRLRA